MKYRKGDLVSVQYDTGARGLDTLYGRVVKAGSVQAEIEWEPTIEVGQWARVIAGPLQGTEGIVCTRMSRTRLALNVRMLSQSVVVEVSRDMLERIAPPAFAK